MKKSAHHHPRYAARLALLAAGSAAMPLLPSMTGAESRVEAGAPGAPLRATAHVDFKIIIPQVLYLELGTGSDRADGAERVAIMSNSRNVTLNAALSTGGSASRGNRILSAPFRKVIAQETSCALNDVSPAGSARPAGSHAVSGGHAPPAPSSAVSSAPSARRVATPSRDVAGKDTIRQVLCTASMP